MEGIPLHMQDRDISKVIPIVGVVEIPILLIIRITVFIVAKITKVVIG